MFQMQSIVLSIGKSKLIPGFQEGVSTMRVGMRSLPSPPRLSVLWRASRTIPEAVLTTHARSHLPSSLLVPLPRFACLLETRPGGVKSATLAWWKHAPGTAPWTLLLSHHGHAKAPSIQSGTLQTQGYLEGLQIGLPSGPRGCASL